MWFHIGLEVEIGDFITGLRLEEGLESRVRNDNLLVGLVLEFFLFDVFVHELDDLCSRHLRPFRDTDEVAERRGNESRFCDTTLMLHTPTRLLLVLEFFSTVDSPCCIPFELSRDSS